MKMTTDDVKSIYLTSSSTDYSAYNWNAIGKTYEYRFTGLSPSTNITLSYNFIDKSLLKPEEISKTNLVSTVEEAVEEYIQDNYDSSTVEDYGHYLYEAIQEKAYEFASNAVEQIKEEYIISDEEAIVDAIIDEIGFDSLYEMAESVSDVPMSFEDHLAEVGMSIRDFI